jgi:hypothetical protein
VKEQPPVLIYRVGGVHGVAGMCSWYPFACENFDRESLRDVYAATIFARV